MSTETNHNAQADGETPPAFRNHSEEIAHLSALCECGHRRGDHMIGDSRCDVDGGCSCQEFSAATSECWGCGVEFTPVAHEGECARCYVARKF